MGEKFKSYANSFQTVIDLSLDRIETMLGFLGNPQNDLKFIHVAGTNGKGSVCAYLQNALTASGKKCGKYISPNMLKVNERISIDGNDISDADLDRVLKMCETASGQTEKTLGKQPSQFEIWTAAAMVYFKEQKCDIVVLETGLGGRFDATNAVKTTLMSVITRIDKDHTDYLGDTLPKIAFEKAGIIKKNSENGKNVTVALYQPETAEVFETVCNEKDNKLVFVSEAKIKGFEDIYEIFDYKNITDIKSGIGGVHQVENAALATEALLQLGVDAKYIKEGIASAKNPGRFDLAAENTIIDGAHNPNGAEALKSSLDRYFTNAEKIYLMGAMADKDITSVLKCVGDSKSEFYFVQVKDNARAETAENLAKKAENCGFEATAFDDIKTAYNTAKNTDKLVVVCGSLYLYKDFYEAFPEVFKK